MATRVEGFTDTCRLLAQEQPSAPPRKRQLSASPPVPSKSPPYYTISSINTRIGSTMNFRGFVDSPMADVNAARLNGTNPLARQSSIYSLTFDELQNTLGGLGKDFGSMNMDELLKSVWNAEETQAITSVGGGAGEGGSSGLGNLQRQGSLTLPRTLSQKTVDEVWKDLFKENEGPGGGNGGEAVSSLPQRQKTLGEITLEEFLVKAGVVREEMQAQQTGRLGDGGFYGDLSRIGNNVNDNNVSLAPKFQQQTQNNGFVGTVTGSNSALTVPRIQPSQYQQQPLFTKPGTVAFASPMNLPNTSQMTSTPAKGVMGIIETSTINAVNQFSGITNGGISVAVPMGMGSPVTSQMSPVVSKNSGDTSSVSPVPYNFSRGRRPNGALEKVVERRQRRMIKNRESAARSRARKQAYTLELEAEIAKLKSLNQELQKQQDEFMEMQKNQVLQTVNGNLGNKRLCLRRTLTGPW